MKNEIYCQSCSMPLVNPQLQGTEQDGSKSREYCKFCYQDGSFTHPDMTLKDMTFQVIEQMEKVHLDSKTIDLAVSSLPYLKRWQSASVTP